VKGFKKIGRLRIERTNSATTLLDLAFSMGLHDIRKWVGIDDAQRFIDHGKWITFIASEIDPTENASIPCGVVGIGVEEEGRLWIELIAVDEKYRRQGIATAMIEGLVQWGKTNKHRALFVDVDDDNYAALQFYKATGFSEAGQISEYYYDASAALVLLKRL